MIAQTELLDGARPKVAPRLGAPPPVVAPPPVAPLLGGFQPPTGDPIRNPVTPTTLTAPSPAPAPAPTPEVIQAQTPPGETPRQPNTVVPPVSAPPAMELLGGGTITRTADTILPAPTGPGSGGTMYAGGNATFNEAGGNAARLVAPNLGPPPDAGITEFGPGNDLRASQINPAASARLAGIAGQSDQARAAEIAAARQGPFEGITARENPVVGQLEGQAIRQVGAGGPAPFEDVAAPGSYEASPEAQRARVLAAQGLENMAGGPNRQQLAEQSLQSFIASTDPGYQRRLRESADLSASMGRVGSGMAADDITRLGRGREAEIIQQSRELAGETAGQELEDRARRLVAAQSAGGQFQGEDLGQAGFRQGLRGEARGERGELLDYGNEAAQLGLQRAGALTGLAGDIYGRGQGLREEARGERGAREGYQERGFSRARALAGDIAGTEAEQFGREAAQRGELRGERGYQGDLAQQAVTNRANQLAMEAALQQQGFGQDLARAQFGERVATGYENQGLAAQDAASEAAYRRALENSLRAGQPTAAAPTSAPAQVGGLIESLGLPPTTPYNDTLTPEQRAGMELAGNYTPQVTGGGNLPGPIAPTTPRAIDPQTGRPYNEAFLQSLGGG